MIRLSRSLGNQEGTTLIEVLITVAILGIAFVSIMGGMGTAIISSALHRHQATGQAGIRSFVEAIKKDTYVECATAYPGTSYTPPTAANQGTSFITSTSVDFLVTGTSTFTTTCPPDSGVQRVTATVTSTVDSAVESIQILKRKP